MPIDTKSNALLLHCCFVKHSALDIFQSQLLMFCFIFLNNLMVKGSYELFVELSTVEYVLETFVNHDWLLEAESCNCVPLHISYVRFDRAGNDVLTTEAPCAPKNIPFLIFAISTIILALYMYLLPHQS